MIFAVGVGATLVVADDTLGYDFLAYHAAASRALAGQPAYDTSFEAAGGFGLFYYPPTFIPLVLAFGLLPPDFATWAWTAGLLAAFVVGVAVLPVARTVKWWIVLLAGLSWPFLYAIKLGQVGPLLFLLMAVGWRWMDRGPVLGVSGALGAAIKIQPGLILAWALLTRRWAAFVTGAVVLAVLALAATLVAGLGAWTDFLALITRVSDPITTPHNFTPGAVAYQLGVSRDTAALLQWVSMGLAALGVRGRCAAAGGGAVLPGGRYRQPAAVTDPVGPLRDRLAAPRGLAAGSRAVVGCGFHRRHAHAPRGPRPSLGLSDGLLGLPACRRGGRCPGARHRAGLR